MAFMNFGKKKKVPDELPALISDEIEQESLNEINTALKTEKKEEALVKEVSEERVGEQRPSAEEINRNKHIVDRLIKGVESTEDRKMPSPVSDKSFFADLQKKIVEEVEDVDSLKNWYNEKMNSGDVLDKMKSYWSSQKKASILDVMVKDFKKKIADKVSELQKLEKDWQSVYFDLIEKEESIKEAEAGLKEMVSEFVVLCKDKKNVNEMDHFSESFSDNMKRKKKRNKKKKNQLMINGGEKVNEKSAEEGTQ